MTVKAKREITVNQGDLIPFDGLVNEGFAFVDESATHGVSTPAMIEAGTERNEVYAGGLVTSGSLKIKANN